MLDHAHPEQTVTDAAARFGRAFAGALGGLKPGSWQGPVRSEFGYHLVIVDIRTPARAATLEEVRSEVTTAWGADQRERALDAFYGELLQRYDVRIEWPADLAPAEPTP